MPEIPRIEELKRRVQIDPASIAFAVLAEEYRRAGQFEAAIDTVTAGLRRHPAYPSAHITLGRALAALTRVNEAKAAFEYVLALAPENLAASRALAEIHSQVVPDDRVGRGGTGSSSPSPTATPMNEAAPAVAMSVVPAHPADASRSSAAAADAVAVSAPPALGGLEVFLQAIARARAADVSAR